MTVSCYLLVSNNARIRVKLHFQIGNAFCIFCRNYLIQRVLAHVLLCKNEK